MPYLTRTPWWLRMLHPGSLLWEMPETDTPTVYLTFDDGPHPEITRFVLEQLQPFNALGTFFCIGKNVVAHPDVYASVLEDGHAVGNHTHNHLNGWKTQIEDYIGNIEEAAKVIDSRLFRPPYGRITPSEVKAMEQSRSPFRIVMWSVLSGDFDTVLLPEDCLKNVLNAIRPGSIVVFHDSEKAFPRLQYALPRVLEYCRDKGWKMDVIPQPD